MKLSFELADRLYFFAQIAGSGGALAVLISLATIYWVSPIRQAYWLEQSRSAEPSRSAPHDGVRETESAIQPDRARTKEVSQRHLTASQRAGLIQAIGNSGAQIMVRVQRSQVDLEARNFADEIIAAFTQAGVNFDVNNYGAIDPPLYGVAMVRSEDNSASETLRQAFVEAGVPLLMLTQPGLDRLQLVVGQNLPR